MYFIIRVNCRFHFFVYLRKKGTTKGWKEWTNNADTLRPSTHENILGVPDSVYTKSTVRIVGLSLTGYCN